MGCLLELRRKHFVPRIGLLAWMTLGIPEDQGNTKVPLPAGRVSLGSVKADKENGWGQGCPKLWWGLGEEQMGSPTRLRETQQKQPFGSVLCKQGDTRSESQTGAQRGGRLWAVLQLPSSHPSTLHPWEHARGVTLTITYSVWLHQHSALHIFLWPFFVSADPWAPARWHSSQLTPPNAENSRHIPEVRFCPVVGLAAPSLPLMSHRGLLSAQGHPTQTPCGLGQQLHPPQGWGAATLRQVWQLTHLFAVLVMRLLRRLQDWWKRPPSLLSPWQ